MNELMLFTDVSVNDKTKIGYGAYLALTEQDLPQELLKTLVRVKRFEHTSSTKLELQTLLWALTDIQTIGNKVIAYTDSQNIMGLQRRRDRLEQNNYLSKNNKLLNNHRLYKEFYRLIDQLDLKLVKVSGHQALNKKEDIDIFFTLVDKASRKAMKEDRGIKKGNDIKSQFLNTS